MHAEQKNNTADNNDVRNQLRSTPEEKEIAANIKAVSNMKPVATLSGSEFSKSKTDLVTQVTDYFDEIGGYVNTEYGKIELIKSGVKSSIGHGIGRNKAIAFKAVPDVLKEGKIIDFQKNWKNRGYDTAVFAAPIKIADKDYFMAAVIVVETERNSYYLHEVAIQEKEDNTLFKTGTVKNGTSGKVLSSPIFTLLQKLQSVKNESEDNTEYQSRNSLSYDRDLVAVHNLSAENLLKSINLGGFAMPSIAITKSKLQHNDYGKISLIFSKDTIDPETHKSNEVYSGDAWTPTFPKIEYKINERKSSKIYDKLYNLFKDNNIERLFSGLDIDDNNIEYYINNRSNWIQTYRDKSEMKLAYLLDTGKPINMPYKESRLSPKYENDIIIKVAKALGFDVVEKGLTYSAEATKLTDKINSIVDEYYSKEVGKSIHFDLQTENRKLILHRQ